MSNAVGVIVSEPATSSVTNFVSSTRNAVQDGMADARAAVDQAWPKVTGAISTGMYNTAYGVAFGLTFPCVLVAKLIPQNNCVVHGLVDGAKAAQSAVQRMSSK
ncbi:MAG: hypothetical protein WCO86_15735 [Planctomycetota bacterium]